MAGSKRAATRDINHDNWDQEDEPESAGVFQKAPEDVLKTRVFKTARRRGIHSTQPEGEEEKKSIFSGFSGFTKPVATSTSTFSFLSNITSKPEEPKANGLSTNQTSMFKTSETENANKSENTNKSENLDEYYGKLKGLNESVSKCIQKHVDTNPFINLQPIFKDYENYINELENLRKKLTSNHTENATEKTGKPAENSKPENTSQYSSFSFKPTAKVSESVAASLTNASQQKPQFSFGSTSATPNFSFSAAAAPSTGFSFGVPNPVSKPASESESNKAGEDEDEDQPPKVEFTPVVEEGHVYTTRCKVFVKKDGNFSDRGVGNFFLKPIPDSGKYQVIVRADTNLGNLLCNFVLSEGIPTQRLGKKDVMLVCLPTPDAKPPPVPILLRVKSTEDADKLLEVLEKHKK